MSREYELLKSKIDNNGIGYISENPFEVYQQLIESKADPSISRLILVTLLAGCAGKAETLDQSALSEYIQNECQLRKDAADQMAALYKEVFSTANLRKWAAKTDSGLKEFCGSDWAFKWDCTKKYHQNGAYVDCTCSIEAEFEVKDRLTLKSQLHEELDKNPFFSSAAIKKCLAKDLESRLDRDVEQFVNGDDYYEPWMPDYDCSDVLNSFCHQYGLQLLDYSCDGDTSDWQRDW